MNFKLDDFNGIIIDANSIPNDEKLFIRALAEVVQFFQAQRKNLIWMTLTIEQSHLIKCATEMGFIYHNCLETEITLILKAQDSAYVPFVPTHTIGAGAIVTNHLGQLLVIKEHGMKGYKLPGGHVDLGESLSAAVMREVFEETGIKTTFSSVLGMVTKHPYRFGKSNMYVICRLLPLSENICIQDMDEIDDAKWVSIKEYIQDDENSSFNRQMIESLHASNGLKPFELGSNEGASKKQDVFFALD